MGAFFWFSDRYPEGIKMAAGAGQHATAPQSSLRDRHCRRPCLLKQGQPDAAAIYNATSKHLTLEQTALALGDEFFLHL